jgi:hypothetical protein
MMNFEDHSNLFIFNNLAQRAGFENKVQRIFNNMQPAITPKTTESYGKNANRAQTERSARVQELFSSSSTSGDRIEKGNHFRGNLKHRRLKIPRRCSLEIVPGITRILGNRWRSRASATCMAVCCLFKLLLIESQVSISTFPILRDTIPRNSAKDQLPLR